MAGTILTNIGLSKLAAATPQNQLNITHIAVGDGNGGFPTLSPNATALTNEVWRGDASNPIKDGANLTYVYFETNIPPEAGPFDVREIACFDIDGDMIAIGHTSLIQKPSPSDDASFAVAVKIFIALENASDFDLIYQNTEVTSHNSLLDRNVADAHDDTAIKRFTTMELINGSHAELPYGSSILTSGHLSDGDGGGSEWIKTESTEIPSKTPSDLGYVGFSDADGYVWLLVEGSIIHYNGSYEIPSGFGKYGVGNYLFDKGQFSALNNITESDTVTILTTGQSNMVGSSNVIEGDTSTNTLVTAWNARFNQNGTNFNIAELGQTPFNGGGQQHIGFNMAKHIADATGKKVKIINMADGGQPIEKWIIGSGDQYMWDAIQREVPKALTAAEIDSVDFIVWHQGEANSSDSVMDYRDKLRAVKSQMASQPWYDEGNTKFIIGGLALGTPTTGTSGARPQQNLAISLFAESDPDVYPIYTGDLVTDSTGVHFTDLSIIEIGKRCGKAALSGGSELSVQPTRYVEASTKIIYDQENGQFRDFDDLMGFISTLKFKIGARLDVYLPRGIYDVNPQRLNFDGNLVRFYGELATDFSKPVKSDFTGAESDDLYMLKSKYLTELVFVETNSCFITDGSNGGTWEDLLVRAESPSFKSTFVRNSDPSLWSSGGGAISFSNVAFHGLAGNSCTAIQADKGAYYDATGCIISHCDNGTLTNAGQLFVKDGLIAHTDNPVNATNRSFVNAYGLSLIGTTGFSYVASIGSYIDAKTADDNANTNIDFNNSFIRV